MSELKGACLLGQSGGPTSVINASAYGIIEAAMRNPQITRVFGAANGIKGILEDRLYDLNLEDPQELALLPHTPSCALGSCRYKLKDPEVDATDYDRLLEVFKKWDIRYFFYIGGNDSMDTCNKISKYMQSSGYECRVIGVPKTIDNDLYGTDHCPGFASAAKYVITSCMEIRRVYKEKGSCIVAVSEGIHDENGTFIAEYGPGLASLDSFGHKQLGGCAATLVAFVKDKLGIQKIRGIELSLLQRCASHCASERDIEESFSAGQQAVEAAVSGATDQMVCFVREKDENGNYRCGLKMENLSLAANAEKKVPREWINSAGNNVEQPFIDYVLPLIQGEPQLHYEQGLPRFARLKKILAK